MEVTLALGIAAFCLVGILGLIPVGITNNQNAIDQTVAVSAARAVVADLQRTPKITSGAASAMSPLFKMTIPGSPAGAPTVNAIFFGEDGTPLGLAGTNGDPTKSLRYRATVTTAYATTKDGSAKLPLTVQIVVTWPAASNLNASAPVANFTGSYEIVTTVDRN